MRATASRAVVVALAAGLTYFGLGTPASASPAPHVAAAITSPITVTMPAASNATISQAQYSSQDVWGGVLSGVATPPSGISPLQRLANLNPPNFRIHAGTDGGAPAVDLPFNAAYTSQDSLHVNAWDFSHLNSLIGNTVGRTSGSMMLNIRYAPDNMFGGSGPLGGNGNAPGALLDQTYGAFATYMANLVKYYNTATPPPGATPARPGNIGPIRYWEIWNEPDFSSENPRIPPSLSAPTGITVTGVNVSGGTLTAGTTYSYRLTALAATNQEGLPSAAASITLPSGTNAVHLTWNPSVNLGRVAAAYSVYGRNGTVGQLVVVGKDNPAGLSWTDKGSIVKGGGVPATDQTPGGPVFSPLEYKAMWDMVVPAMKAVDPTIKVVGPVTTNPVSIASGSVVPTAVTSGPNDSSWLDNRDYVQVLMTSVNRPDVVSYHGYGGYLGNESDSSLMSTISQIAADVQSNIKPYVGSTPIWHTEANVNAGDDPSNRPALAFGAAWEASLFARLAPIGVSTIHEYSYSQSPTFGLITEPGSSVAGAVEGNPYLPYWVEYWIDHLIMPGSKILSVANVPAGMDVLAVANPPDFGKVKMLVVNRQVPATSSAVSVQLAGATSTDTRVRLIDSSTDLVNGPGMTDTGAAQSASLQLNGYSIGLVEFDTRAGSPPPGPSCTASTNTQYTLTGSDGTNWADMDATNLVKTLNPTSSGWALLEANADLWTERAGYNQDLGIFVSIDGGPDNLVGWKESGGSGGVFSPNAAFLQAPYAVTAGHAYTVKLKWKTNKPAAGVSIHSAAGPSAPFSPTTLVARLLPSGQLSTVASTAQDRMANNDGVTWAPIDGGVGTTLTLNPTTTSTAILGGNSDLWTGDAGYNQDLGIFVSANGGADQLLAWKESGGFNGIFSPNAAFVQTVYPMASGSSYVFKLKWKANRPDYAPIGIASGAGPGSPFSPTRLTAEVVTAAGNPQSSAILTQPTLSNSDGVTWQPVSGSLDQTVSPTSDGVVNVGANADLWTENAGFNQDLGIFVSTAGGPDQLIAWKESGGFNGVFSPNAAFAETEFAVKAGVSYVFKMKWKTNKNAPGATIHIAAGPSAPFSPTRLTAEMVAC